MREQCYLNSVLIILFSLIHFGSIASVECKNELGHKKVKYMKVNYALGPISDLANELGEFIVFGNERVCQLFNRTYFEGDSDVDCTHEYIFEINYEDGSKVQYAYSGDCKILKMGNSKVKVTSEFEDYLFNVKKTKFSYGTLEFKDRREAIKKYGQLSRTDSLVCDNYYEWLDYSGYQEGKVVFERKGGKKRQLKNLYKELRRIESEKKVKCLSRLNDSNGDFEIDIKCYSNSPVSLGIEGYKESLNFRYLNDFRIDYLILK